MGDIMEQEESYQFFGASNRFIEEQVIDISQQQDLIFLQDRIVQESEIQENIDFQSHESKLNSSNDLKHLNEINEIVNSNEIPQSFPSNITPINEQSSSLSQKSNSNDSFCSQKQTESKPLSLFKHIFPRYSFQIFGDIMVHTDIASMGEFVKTCSPINLDKKIVQILHEKGRKIVVVSFEETNTTFIEFDSFIHIFSEYPDNTLHQFGDNLMKYKQYAMKQLKMIDFCKKQNGFSTFCELKNIKYSRFKKAMEKVLNSFKDQFMCFYFQKRNYQTGGLEFEQIGFNENLIKLLGLSVSDYEEMARRIGVYCFQSKYSYNFLFNQFLVNMHYSMQKSIQDLDQTNGILQIAILEYSSQMLTIDEQILDSKNRIITYADCTDEDALGTSDLLKFKDLLHIQTISISKETQKTLEELRHKSTQQQQMIQYDEIVQKSSLQYELEASAFIEKYYGKKQQSDYEKNNQERFKLEEKQKQCNYKIIERKKI